jgi:hypothetical protein
VTLIVGSLGFIYILNILGAISSDETKRKYLVEFTCAWAVTNKERNVCGVNIYLKGIIIDSSILMKYQVIVQMETFRVFARIRFLPSSLKTKLLISFRLLII